MNKYINETNEVFPSDRHTIVARYQTQKLVFFFLFKADPYLIVSLGKKKYDEQDNFKPNTLNPVFGK